MPEIGNMNDRGFINTLYQQFKNKTLFYKHYEIAADLSGPAYALLVKFPQAATWTQSTTTVTITATAHGYGNLAGQYVTIYQPTTTDADGGPTVEEMRGNTYAVTYSDANTITITTTASATVTAGLGDNTMYIACGVPEHYITASAESLVLLYLDMAFTVAGDVVPVYKVSSTYYHAGPPLYGATTSADRALRFLCLPADTDLYIYSTTAACRGHLLLNYTFSDLAGGVEDNVTTTQVAV